MTDLLPTDDDDDDDFGRPDNLLLGMVCVLLVIVSFWYKGIDKLQETLT